MRVVLVLLIAVVALFAPPPAMAGSERIINFASDITVGTDGVLTVTETIEVEAAGYQIRHGIYRDFPTVARTQLGGNRRVSFDVRDVRLDGGAVPYSVESIPNGRRVKIGDPNRFVDPGVHTYVLTYTSDRQISFYPEFDELYWNVTGNFWAFTIENAEALIHIPETADMGQWSFYTGPVGARGKNAVAEKIGAHTLRVRSTQPLYSSEGLTVAVAFSKGAIAPPSATTEKLLWLRDNAPTVAAAAGLLALLGYYGLTWLRYGRDPDPGTIVPLFAPPRDFSPAAVRYVAHMGFDQKAFSAALISMAVKGYLTIREEGGDYSLTRTGKSETECKLDAGESAVAAMLFAGRQSIALKQSNHSTISRAISNLSSALARACQPRYFVTNRVWFFGGLAVALISVLLAVVLSNTPDAVAPVAMMIGWTVGLGFLGSTVVTKWRGAIAAPGMLGGHVFAALFASFFGIIFVSIFTTALYSIARQAGLLPATIFFSLQGLAALVFYHLLKAPTVEGARVRGEIAGFRMFLDTAEKERLEILHPPEVTPEVFEKFLPYAIALDAENAWSRRFESEASAAGVAPSQSSYSPGWYSGTRSFSRLGTAGFASALGATLSS